ncbi:helix-turn-helix transcriptional regulator [Microbacterium karelineae]|uniref:helix-turn-helix transcriptional regulator n=1 Tax=Microbacterium karelineae TaxID=2654283 RepID=UPI0012EA48EE|nr:YafY family protein [Microbacterium karelineae]
MRADRLVAALLLMQARGRVTAAELAEELEVSVATARRDLVAMSTAGFPVYPQPGRGGGWQLLGGARTDLTGLTAHEARALFRLVGPGATASDEAKSALRKLMQALPETFRESAELAADATIIDASRWGERETREPVLVSRLRTAVEERRRVRLIYWGRGAGPTTREIDPWGLVDKDGVWYLLAGTDRGRRTFRVERVVSAEVLDERAERPDDFSLEDAWASAVDEVENMRSITQAVVEIDGRHLAVLRRQFGRHCDVEGAEGGVLRVRIGASTALDIARHLAGWGAEARVIESDEVRAEIARIGAELTRAYG